MDGSPCAVERVHESVLVLTIDLNGCMPPRTSVQDTQDDVLVNEEQVHLHLLVEGVRDVNTADMRRTGFAPLPADRAGADNLRNQLQSVMRHSSSSKELLHGLGGCMPPPSVELPECQSDRTLAVGTKDPYNPADVEV